MDLMNLISVFDCYRNGRPHAGETLTKPTVIVTAEALASTPFTFTTTVEVDAPKLDPVSAITPPDVGTLNGDAAVRVGGA